MDCLSNNWIIHENHNWWGDSIKVIYPPGYGYAKISIYKESQHIAIISDLSVVEEERKHGIASMVLAECIKILKEKLIYAIQVSVEKSAPYWLGVWYMRLGFILYDEDEHLWHYVKTLRDEVHRNN